MSQFKAPVIVFHGKHDSVTSYHNSEKFVYSTVRPYKKLHLFETGYHELQHDQEKDELLESGSNYLKELPAHLVKAFGKLNVQKIDTKPKRNHFLRNLLIVVIVALVLLKVLRTKGKTGNSLLWTIFNALRGVKTAK